MRLTSGDLFWKDKKIKKTYPYITEDMKCDILVVGGGISRSNNCLLFGKRRL